MVVSLNAKLKYHNKHIRRFFFAKFRRIIGNMKENDVKIFY